ncbi:MAG: enoyl-CoA hydratase/isomerase family protein [Acidobacteria bacterium]|nr:enoyl-CoA hydratase/isomerase family protein [Acidobacteriota bacterium]
MTLQLIHEGSVSRIRMKLAPMNLLNLEVLDELINLHQQADKHPETRVIVTQSDLPNMFCNGLDPMYVLKADRAGREAIFRGIARLFRDLLSLQKPHLAVLNGPAMAGGAIIALTADFRLMDQEHGRFCFSEPKVGLPIPQAIAQTIAHFCAPAALREVVLMGKNMDAAYAVQVGMADWAGPSSELMEATQTQVAKLERLSPAVLAATKQALRGHLIRMAQGFADDAGDFLHFVEDDFVGEGLKALVEGRKPQFKR